MCNFLKFGVLFRFCGVTVLLALLLLIVKGFTYSLPNLSHRNIKTAALKRNARNYMCPSGENYDVIMICSPCTKYQMNFEKACALTGNVEQVECKSMNKYQILSCPFSVHAEAKKFWTFEACVMTIALLSNVMVCFRRRSNDALMYQRLKRQISDADATV